MHVRWVFYLDATIFDCSPSFLIFFPQQQQDLTMMNKKRPGKKRKDRVVRMSLPEEDEGINLVESKLERFQSVLDRPFNKWNEMEDVLAAFVPEWNHTERGYLLQHLIHFLELKVVMEENIPGQLLAPTKLVDKAWQALVLESRLYKKVTGTIQSFHGRPRCHVHYSLLTGMKGDMYESQLHRTQSLFQCYYGGQQMPISLDDVLGSGDCSAAMDDDASSLTDVLTGLGLNQRSAAGSSDSGIGKCSPTEIYMNACHATMFCADEYVVYGICKDDEDYESCVTPDTAEESTEQGVVEAIECVVQRK
jgi:hypothetical protein